MIKILVEKTVIWIPSHIYIDLKLLICYLNLRLKNEKQCN